MTKTNLTQSVQAAGVGVIYPVAATPAELRERAANVRACGSIARAEFLEAQAETPCGYNRPGVVARDCLKFGAIRYHLDESGIRGVAKLCAGCAGRLARNKGTRMSPVAVADVGGIGMGWQGFCISCGESGEVFKPRGGGGWWYCAGCGANPKKHESAIRKVGRVIDSPLSDDEARLARTGPQTEAYSKGVEAARDWLEGLEKTDGDAECVQRESVLMRENTPDGDAYGLGYLAVLAEWLAKNGHPRQMDLGDWIADAKLPGGGANKQEAR